MGHTRQRVSDLPIMGIQLAFLLNAEFQLTPKCAWPSDTKPAIG